MRRVATNVVEVRDGSVKNYFGDYDNYLESIESEIDEGERQRAAGQGNGKSKAQSLAPKSKTTDYRETQRAQRKVEKEIKNLEKKIARLDDEKRAIGQKLLNETDPDEAVRLHEQQSRVAEELQEAEERWLELSGDL